MGKKGQFHGVSMRFRYIRIVPFVTEKHTIQTTPNSALLGLKHTSGRANPLLDETRKYMYAREIMEQKPHFFV